LAVAIALHAGAGDAAEPGRTARLLAGLDSMPALQPYVRAVSDRWDEYERRIGAPMREWARTEVAAPAGGTVFYPLSGPDFPTVAQLYPDAERFVLVAAQRAGAPPALERLSPAELASFLPVFGRGWGKFARSGFFNTRDLDAAHVVPTALLMAFAARLGYEVAAVEPVRVEDAGGELAPHPGDRALRETWSSVRLTLVKAGRTVRLDYVRMELSDAHLAAVPASRAWIERTAANPTVLKAASHLPQRAHFSILREAIVAHAPSVWQDETGIDYAHLAAAFSVQLYGQFTGPNRVFARGSQQSLAAAHAVRGDVLPLPFRVGYEKRTGSSVQVAVRDAAGLEARIAERLARYAKRPRKLFVGGGEGDLEYVAVLKTRVAGFAQPRAAGLDPGRTALVTLTLAQDGSLNAFELDRGSGNAAFDRDLRAFVQRSGPFPPLPEGIRQRADLLVVTLQLPER
jgi:TonB family protein